MAKDRSNQKVMVRDTGWNLEQLGSYLGKNYDISILSETHGSVPLTKAQAKVFGSTGSEKLYQEGQPSYQSRLDRRDESILISNFGQEMLTVKQAFKSKIPVKAVDIEPGLSPEYTKITTYREGTKNVYGALERAKELALSYLEDKNVDVSNNQPNPGTTNVAAVKGFIEKYSSQLPDFHKDNLIRAAKKADRYENPGIGAVIGNAVDAVKDAITLPHATSKVTEERNRTIGNNTANDFANLKDVNPDANASLVVGANHAHAAEKIIEQKGFTAANVKFVVTNEQKMDNKVFIAGKNKENIEFVVAIYDPNHERAEKFSKKYEVVPAQQELASTRSQNGLPPKDLPHNGAEKHR